jgi:hypothetical protein
MNLTGKGGFQERKQHINRKGRPRSFDELRRITQEIGREKITIGNGEVMTRVERILRDWSESKDVQKQIAFVQYGYGKPVDKIETNLEPKQILRLHFAHEFDDKFGDTASNSEGTHRPLLSDAEELWLQGDNNLSRIRIRTITKPIKTTARKPVATPIAKRRLLISSPPQCGHLAALLETCWPQSRHTSRFALMQLLLPLLNQISCSDRDTIISVQITRAHRFVVYAHSAGH